MGIIVANISLDGSDISALEFDDDMRGVSLKGATIGVFDARGRRLTLQFLERATFGELQHDDTTQLYDAETGQLIDGFEVVEVEGGFAFKSLE